MTRTARAPELCRHAPEPVLELNLADAEALEVSDGALVEVKTPSGTGIFAASVTATVRPGVASVPMHWTDAFAPAGRANALTGSDCDPESGQPEFKHASARLRAFGETWRGFAVVRAEQIDWPKGVVWRRTPFAAAQVFEIAGRGGAGQRNAVIAAALGAVEGETLALDDDARAVVRRAVVAGDRLDAAVFIGPATASLPPCAWIADRFADAALSPADRAALLLGRSVDAPDEGALVCACMGVGRKRIDAAITDGADSVDAIGEATAAGTSCGSCRPELARFLAAAKSEPSKVAAEVSDAA
jgi:assimilatory nitrate reductase catalytic subunit